MMHYHATEEDHAKLEKKGFLLVDSGATYMDGTTDITRTYPLGELTEDERLFYTWTLQCHIDIARAVWLDYCDGHMLDTIAREPLWRHLINYRCGTGHSVSHVGNVHEGPHALNGRNTTVFKPGMIVTDEPGVYEGGVVGIRIENELECYHKASNQYGEFLAFRPITFVPIATSPIVPGVLSRDELDWLNAYHREVFEKLAPRLTEDERDWLAFVLGKVDMSALNVEMLMSFNIPQPFKYGVDFNVSSFIAIGLVYLITAIEATGDVTANSMISGLPIEGDSYLKRVSGGVMADGFNSFLAGIFNSFPNSIFAQNNGIIQLTGVASRYVGYYIAAMLVLLGLFPIVGAVFSLMPDPVLGGATLLMFGTVAAAGIRIISSQEIGRKETLVLAVSLSLGLGVELMPDVLQQAPEAIRSIFSSGITTGGLTAIIANIVIRVKE